MANVFKRFRGICARCFYEDLCATRMILEIVCDIENFSVLVMSSLI